MFSLLTFNSENPIENSNFKHVYSSKMKEINFPQSTGLFPFHSEPKFGSINEQNNLNFKIYPNPMKEFAWIKLDKQSNVELSIFNLYGQLIFQNNYVRGQSITIDNDSFKSGTYFVKIKSEDSSIGVKKLIIK